MEGGRLGRKEGREKHHQTGMS